MREEDRRMARFADGQGQSSQQRDPWTIAWQTLRNFIDQEGLQWSGAVAFYLVLSVPPLLIAAFSIGVVVVGDETAHDFLTSQIAQFLPAQRGVVERIVGATISSTGVAIPVSLAFLLFSGSRVFAAVITAINVMWRELPEPGFIRRQVTRVVMLITTGGLFALAGAADLAVALAGEALPSYLTIVLRTQVLPTALLISALFLLFRIVPRRAATWKSAAIGAVAGAALLRVAQLGFTAYLGTFAGFDSAYGPVAGSAILMTWALVASGVILLAAHLVAVLDQPDDSEAHEYRTPGTDGAKR